MVYASPGTIAAHRKDRHFLAGWFVMVNDNVGRFPGRFGATARWAWFDTTDPKKTTSTDYKTDCQCCHVSARKSDGIYTRGYPVLN